MFVISSVNLLEFKVSDVINQKILCLSLANYVYYPLQLHVSWSV